MSQREVVSNPDNKHRRQSVYDYSSLNRQLNPIEYHHVHEMALWHEYQRLRRVGNPNPVLDALLKRHDKLLRDAAQKSAEMHPNWTEFKDQYSNAMWGAMLAYNKFDPVKAEEHGNKLSSYVYLRVTKWLRTALDKEAFINCPQGCSGMRSYLSGKYDNLPDKKASFETEHGLTCEDSRAAAREKYLLLTPTMMSLEAQRDTHQGIKGNEYEFEDFLAIDTLGKDDHLLRLEIEQKVRKLSERQQNVMHLFMQENYTMQEVADMLSLTEDQVRGDIRTIRRTVR